MDVKDSTDFVAHILVIDDDDRIRNLLKKYLSSENFLVSVAKDAFDAEKLVANIKYDLIVSDKMMPKKDGIDFIKDLRSVNNNTPVIILTAVGDIDNKLLGFSIGADDYIAKPFEPKELLFRIKNILKRTGINNKNEIKFGSFSFNLSSNVLKKGEEVIKLTNTQKSLIAYFINNPNKVLTRNDLLSVLPIADERSVDVAITRLRKKIYDEKNENKFITTIRNVGYKFVI